MQRLGQHFLQARDVLRAVANALKPEQGQTIVEIGPGHGELTKELQAQHAKFKSKIFAIEKDAKLAESLRIKFAGDATMEIIEGDALKLLSDIVRLKDPKTTNYAVVGNIPYYITGRVLRILGELEPRPSRVVLTIQKEVAERMCAEPPRMNKLAAIVQFWAEPKIIRIVPRSAFRPEPDVDSAVITLTTKAKPPAKRVFARYTTIARVLFAQPRKTILNNLRAGFGKEAAEQALRAAELAPELRPQDLSPTDITRIAAELPAPRP